MCNCSNLFLNQYPLDSWFLESFLPLIPETNTEPGSKYGLGKSKSLGLLLGHGEVSLCTEFSAERFKDNLAQKVGEWSLWQAKAYFPGDWICGITNAHADYSFVTSATSLPPPPEKNAPKRFTTPSSPVPVHTNFQGKGRELNSKLKKRKA